jgi:predicted site-specific integrase-resolvase
MRTAIYARVSTKDGRQDTENQLRQVRAFAVTLEYLEQAIACFRSAMGVSRPVARTRDILCTQVERAVY